jgi:hypothetical protein
VFDGPPEKPEVTSEDIEKQKEIVEEASKLAEEIGGLDKTSEQDKESVQKGIAQRLDAFRDTFSLEQLQKILSALNAQKDHLVQELKERTAIITNESAERRAQLRKYIGPYVDRISDTAKEAVVKSGLPEWAQMALNFVNNNAVTRFVQKYYHVLMANVDKILPEKFKQWLPFLKEQADGAKIMLLKIGARDGIADAVEEMKQQGVNFEVEWTDFDAAWDNHFKTQYGEELKQNTGLTSREFMKRKMMLLIKQKYDEVVRSVSEFHPETVLIFDLGNYSALKPAPGEAPQQTAPAPEAPRTLADFKLDRHDASKPVDNLNFHEGQGPDQKEYTITKFDAAMKTALLVIAGKRYELRMKKAAGGNDVLPNVYFEPKLEGNSILGSTVTLKVEARDAGNDIFNKSLVLALRDVGERTTEEKGLKLEIKELRNA